MADETENTEDGRRSYSSPLRERQADATRNQILDALTQLLATHRSDEISTGQIAEAAGVSRPTVYRHFPDRTALVEGLADRVEAKGDELQGPESSVSVEEFVAAQVGNFAIAEDHVVEATAEALLNSDPRRLSVASQQRSQRLTDAVAASFPALDDHQRQGVVALLRSLGSAQTWLRMREEFGLSGDESGPIVVWAMEIMVEEIRRGQFPGATMER